RYNGDRIGLTGYQAMLEGDFRAIPDLRFNIQLLVSEPPHIASRLRFDCTPAGMLFGLPVNGRRVRFSENVFYDFVDGRIESVWSIIDKAAIEAQLRPVG
ncbi:ester cyclase, partial [Rhizobiaceae sp. 2RAB30]